MANTLTPGAKWEPRKTSSRGPSPDSRIIELEGQKTGLHSCP
ncbi:rCG21458 [Rattus norvegicus]|uniref:RCG21458 n=1 Tax=Rattus norvegicus TaxID=10116 RepID=A6J0H0_RAT|nr:rCG21458 [Rattus norvegicus]